MAEVTLSAELVETKTGKLIKTLMVTGTPPQSSKPVDMDDARALAAGDAVTKLKNQLLEEPKQIQKEEAATGGEQPKEEAAK